MNRHAAPHDAPHDAPHGLAPAYRKWPVGIVLVVALALMAAVPLVGRVFH